MIRNDDFNNATAVQVYPDPAKLRFVLVVEFSKPIQDHVDLLNTLEEYVVIERYLDEENRKKVARIEDIRNRQSFFKKGDDYV